jgi:hypothetical protein
MRQCLLAVPPGLRKLTIVFHPRDWSASTMQLAKLFDGLQHLELRLLAGESNFLPICCPIRLPGSRLTCHAFTC